MTPSSPAPEAAVEEVSSAVPALTAGEQARLREQVVIYFTAARHAAEMDLIGDKVVAWLMQCQRYQQGLTAQGAGASRRKHLLTTSRLACRLLATLEKRASGSLGEPRGQLVAAALAAGPAATSTNAVLPDGHHTPRAGTLQAHRRLQERVAALTFGTGVRQAGAQRVAHALQAQLDRLDANSVTDALLLGAASVRLHAQAVAPQTTQGEHAALLNQLAVTAVGYGLLAAQEPVRPHGRSKRPDPLVLAVEGLVAIWRDATGTQPHTGSLRTGVLTFCQMLMPVVMLVSDDALRHALEQVVQDLASRGKTTRPRRQRVSKTG